MITLIGGPAAASYMIKRAPLFLRAVVKRPGEARYPADGDKDVLDQLDDTPADDEAVFVYKLQGEISMVHINRGRRGSGFYAMGQYAYLPDVDGEALRGTLEWRDWVLARPDLGDARDPTQIR